MSGVKEYVRAEAFQRVLRIESRVGKGTAFTIERGGREWLVTARHLLPEEPAPEVRLTGRSGEFVLRLGFIPGLADQTDIAVAPLENPITPQLALIPHSDGVIWSQDVYFLGFPFGMATQISHDPTDQIAFVKHAIVSASIQATGTRLWFLDGHNNPGFSGGPVVAHTPESETMQVIGVVAGNRGRDRPIVVQGQPLETAVVRENTGIIVATDIHHVNELIDAA